MPVNPSPQSKSIVSIPEQVTAFLAKCRAHAATQEGSVSGPVTASVEPPRASARGTRPGHLA
jgi:hypothetical protein